MLRFGLVSLLAALGTASGVHAFEFRCRFVERTGTVDTVISGNFINAEDGSVHNIRIQFGVFDDASGPAPEGGFLGWNLGSIVVSGSESNSDERRNGPGVGGRLSPFNFASGPNSNGNPPLPGGDPFTMLTEIDATLGTQSPQWICNPDGTIPPQPPPVVRGRNTFVSVFAFSIDPSQFGRHYTVSVAGNLTAATSWLPIGNPVPPDCGGDPHLPDDDVPGVLTYAPMPTAPQAIGCELFVYAPEGPTPAPAALLGLGLLAAARRRRVYVHVSMRPRVF